MRYRIEYADGRCCNFANSGSTLLGLRGKALSRLRAAAIAQ